ncbi:MAG: Hsp70 family protein [Syntrophomonadaceae bacterium]|nr:Hsp70 family protein [Syntrophomonadaceae bacterium]
MQLGIDFGTSYTKLGYWDGGQFINLAGNGQRIPSVVTWLPSIPRLFFGNLAYRLEEPGAIRTDFFKLALKRNPDFSLGPFKLTQIIQEFFSFLEQEYLYGRNPHLNLKSISLSVPNYFGLNSRRILLEAARDIFKVENIYLIPEPVAAIGGYNISHPENPLQGDILCIDIGGGTSDFSFLRVLQDSREILLETQLQLGSDVFSGSEIDRNILKRILFPCFRMKYGEELPEQFLNENFISSRDKFIFNSLMRQAEKLKIEMSSQERSCIDIPDFYGGKSLQLEIDQNMFKHQLEHVFNRLKIFFNESVKMRAQNLNLHDGHHWKLDYVLLQGGASQITGVTKMVQELCTGITLIQPKDLDLNVVRGLSKWNTEGLAAYSRVKTIFPFQFYIERINPENNMPELEKIRFDTANLELDIDTKYKIFSFNPDSHYNLAVDSQLLSCKIYEVEEADSKVGLERFCGQELVWRLDISRETAPETINIYLDMARSQLVSSDQEQPNKEEIYPELHKNFLLTDHKALDWISEYAYARKALLSDFRAHLSQQENKHNLPVHDHAQTTKYKLLCLLDFLTRT